MGGGPVRQKGKYSPVHKMNNSTCEMCFMLSSLSCVGATPPLHSPISGSDPGRGAGGPVGRWQMRNTLLMRTFHHRSPHTIYLTTTGVPTLFI